MAFYPAPKPKNKNICENPGCSNKGKMKYRGYFTYLLCVKCYFEWYHAFCEWIHELNHWRCIECGRKKGLFVHHKIFRSQGGKHIKENCDSLCGDCHKPFHN